jgi:superoxide reductase
MNELKFYVCKHCGNIITKVKNSGVDVVCCDEKMTEMIPNTVEASFEKHIPYISINGNIVNVKVGEIEHPMTEEHHIEWVYIKTKKGAQRKFLNFTDKPEVEFCLIDDELESVYAYCNLHGLWKKEV